MMCEVNCTNCRVSAFKHGFCPDDFCEKHKALGTEDDFIKMIQRKTGKWIPLQLSMAHPPYQCSCCFRNAPMVESGCLVNRYLEALLTPYCPNCGARMEEGGQK